VLDGDTRAGAAIQAVEDPSAPTHADLALTVSVNKERAAAQRHRGSFREVEEAFVKCGQIAARNVRRNKSMSGPPATMSLSARLSRNKKAKRGTLDARPHSSTVTRLRKNVGGTKTHFRGKAFGDGKVSPAVVSMSSPTNIEKDAMWFADVASNTFTAFAEAVRQPKPITRKPRPASAIGSKTVVGWSDTVQTAELFGGDETWQEAYSRRYREVLLKKLMAVDPEDGESLEALWSDILEDDHLSGKDTAIIELRARVTEEFRAALNTSETLDESYVDLVNS